MSSETKKPRAMTIKRFATAKLSGKTTAEGFLSAHMGLLLNHPYLYPVLDAYEKKELLPDVALQAIQSALLAHILASEIKTEEAKLLKREQESHLPKGRRPKGGNGEVDESEVPSARYTVTLYVQYTDKITGQPYIGIGVTQTVSQYKIRVPGKGDIYVDTKEEAEGYLVLEKVLEDHPTIYDADDFGAAMRLADRRLFQREDSVYATIVNNQGKPITTNVQRGDAIARILRQPKGAAVRTRGRSTKTLGFQPHASQTRVTGPWSNRTR